MKKAFILCFILSGFNVCLLKSQTLERVTHSFGISNINGVDVEVIRHGSASTYNSCGVGPYWIGGVSTDGAYSFIFTPAVSELRLDFNMINGMYTSGIEEVQIFINGQHFPLSNIGDSLLGCAFIAEITAQGNISGSVPTRQYGWENTRISGQIDSLKVYNKVISGAPYGSIFSLYIGYTSTETHELENQCNQIKILTNWFSNKIQIVSIEEVVNLQLINSHGIVLKSTNTNALTFDHLSPCLYFLKVKTSSCEVTRKILKHY